jgi:hypothetical protein
LAVDKVFVGANTLSRFVTKAGKVLTGVCLFVLLFCPKIHAETVITEGIAFIGSGITLEDAKLIALNDARQKAVNSLGAVVESETSLVNYKLSKDESRTISSSIMASEILQTRKEVIDNSFVLKIKVRFDISTSSLRNAFKHYQDKSKDQITVKYLVATIESLQSELLKAKQGTCETVGIVDEIEFLTKRVGKLLTTGQTIKHELEIQEFYKKRTETYFKNTLLPRLHDELTKLMTWEEVPELTNDDTLSLKFVGFTSKETFEKRLKKYLLTLISITDEYEGLKLRVHPEFSYDISFKLPVYVYINKEKLNYCIPVTFSKTYSHQIILEPPFLCSKRYRLPFGKLELHSRVHGYVPERYFVANGDGFRFGKLESHSEVHGYVPKRYFVANGDGFHYLDGHVEYHWNIALPKRLRLSDIENIEVRLGRVNPKDIQFIFFR